MTLDRLRDEMNEGRVKKAKICHRYNTPAAELPLETVAHSRAAFGRNLDVLCMGSRNGGTSVHTLPRGGFSLDDVDAAENLQQVGVFIDPRNHENGDEATIDDTLEQTSEIPILAFSTEHASTHFDRNAKYASTKEERKRASMINLCDIDDMQAYRTAQEAWVKRVHAEKNESEDQLRKAITTPLMVAVSNADAQITDDILELTLAGYIDGFVFERSEDIAYFRAQWEQKCSNRKVKEAFPTMPYLGLGGDTNTFQAYLERDDPMQEADGLWFDQTPSRSMAEDIHLAGVRAIQNRKLRDPQINPVLGPRTETDLIITYAIIDVQGSARASADGILNATSLDRQHVDIFTIQNRSQLDQLLSREPDNLVFVSPGGWHGKQKEGIVEQDLLEAYSTMGNGVPTVLECAGVNLGRKANSLADQRKHTNCEVGTEMGVLSDDAIIHNNDVSGAIDVAWRRSADTNGAVKILYAIPTSNGPTSELKGDTYEIVAVEANGLEDNQEISDSTGRVLAFQTKVKTRAEYVLASTIHHTSLWLWANAIIQDIVEQEELAKKQLARKHTLDSQLN